MLDLQSILIPQSGIIFRMIGDIATGDGAQSPEYRPEGILILPERGQIKVINEIGARVWLLIDGQLSVQEIASKITDEYQVDLVEAQRDILDYVNELEERGLVTPRD